MNIIEQTNDFCINYLKCVKKAANSLWITQSQALCIQAIPFDGISQTDLATKLSLDLSTLSRNLDKLSKIHLIEKVVSAFDKRSYKITLTTRGQNIYQQLNDKINNYFLNIYSKLDMQEIDKMVDILNKINWEFELSKNE
tara:strand:- start:382 stop:801 length:420 start_codon:yes stop_codon:yes gene_type:complete